MSFSSWSCFPIREGKGSKPFLFLQASTTFVRQNCDRGAVGERQFRHSFPEPHSIMAHGRPHPSFATADDGPKKRFSFKDLRGFGRMQKYLKPYVAHFTVGMLVMSISGFLTLVITRLWGQLGGVGASVSTGEVPMLGIELDDLASIGWTLLGALAIQSFFSFVRVLLFADMTEKMMLSMRQDAFDALVSMPMAFYDARRVGDLNSRISADIATIQDIFTVTLAELFRGLILIVGGIVALAYFSVELTLWMLGTLPVMIVAAVVFGRFIHKLSKQTQDEVAASNVVVQDV